MRAFKLAFGSLFFGTTGILCIVWVVVTMRRAEYLSTIAITGIGIACFSFVVPAFKILPGDVNPQCAYDSHSTTIRPDKTMELAGRILLISLIIGMGLFAIFYPLGILDIPIPHTMRYSIPFISGASAIMATPILWRNLKRGGYKFLKLTPDGFEISEGSTSPRGAWTDVRDVGDRVPGEPPPKDYNAVVIVMSDGQTPAISADSITPGGWALREWVRFYWQHPEHRDELTDGRAIERLRGEEFAAE